MRTLVRKYPSLVALGILFVMFLVGCGEEEGPTAPVPLDGAMLVGLAANDTLRYYQVDSVVTIDTTYRVDVTEQEFIATTSGGGDEFVYSFGREPLVNVLRTAESVLINGYWRSDESTLVITYFADPPVLLHRNLVPGDTWDGYMPSYSVPPDYSRLPIYFAHFGFYFQKTYQGTEHVIVPSGEYTAHRYDSRLYINPGDSVAAAIVTEHFVPNFGLVRYTFRGGGLTRVLARVE